MDQGENEDEASNPENPPCEVDEVQSEAQRKRRAPDPEPESASGSGPSCVSLRSDKSKDAEVDFRSECVAAERNYAKRRICSTSGPSCISLKSDRSKDIIHDFKSGHMAAERMDQELLEGPSSKSTPQDQSAIDSTFQLVENNMFTFMKEKLQEFKKRVSGEERQMSDKDMFGVDEEKDEILTEMFLEMTILFLKGIKEDDLADRLQSNFPTTCQRKLKTNQKKKFQCLFEGIAKAGNPTLLNEIYTELYITEGGTGELNEEHEVRQIEAASRKADRAEKTIKQEEIFKPLPGRQEPIRTVMTKGVAGIGKTVLTQKFTLDWAEGKAKQNIHFIFPFTFRELNVLKNKKFSLVELVHHFFPETKGICSFEDFQIIFIFDGLDECRLPLDFRNSEIVTDVTQSTSVGDLLTNLIRGNLLPSALLWITTRPAAANQIPAECVGMVTEVRGFADPQKEEYFRKRFKDKKQASTIISHIKRSRSLHIMCHIPVFCWITATVLEDLLKSREGGELPKTLTEMYVHFLVVQAKVKKVKYDGGAETDPHWSPESRKMMESLGKLAFEQLQKGNLIFYESDLTECGINVTEASVYSGVLTQIFIEEKGLYQDKVYCFIHLSIQEFLAALHVHMTFMKSGVNLLAEEQTSSQSSSPGQEPTDIQFYQTCVNAALKSQNGHLDLFLRFLLGLSKLNNQTLLQGLLVPTGSSIETDEKTIQHIKKKISENVSVEKNINLFHCLNELDDNSLAEEIQNFLNSGRLSVNTLSSLQWSALVVILLSDKDLDVFDLKKYSGSEEVLLKLLPVVKASNKALLSNCKLSERSCKALAEILSCESCSLRELGLSNNDLGDLGLKHLCVGLENPKCPLETLSLSGCGITKEGCTLLASALNSNPSHLKELDLSYNHPGTEGVKLLTPILDTLRVDPAGEEWLTPGLKKYSCQLSIDTNTVSRMIELSDNNSRMTRVDVLQPYPDHDDRFDLFQLLCRDALSGRCYWEVEWSGRVDVAVSYKGIKRKGDSDDRWFGFNDQSWMLCCDDTGYSIWHRNENVFVPSSSLSSSSNKVAVYVDYPAGILSFFEVSDTLIHLHTFNTTFTGPLYPGFGFEFRPGSWLSLCPV
ncbi:NLR family CARD domain-containing protein 3 isoform X1 [Oryzias melastigma]|uniref:NLR family CARD domain-containing protein 3 isoform X1 n=1 Tax=Oryzias melastigma TaxID=30732 RepID=UPI00168D1131|nr:NLR family CARD domain-containing protein 3 isoform X1 [Oryzias melastigma]